MKLSPPLCTLALIATVFGFMAWRQSHVSYVKVYYTETPGGLQRAIEDIKRMAVEPACPQWDGIAHSLPNGVPHERKMQNILACPGGEVVIQAGDPIECPQLPQNPPQ